MAYNNFLKRNIHQISKGGFSIIIKKIITLIKIFFSIPIYIFSIPVLICLYLIRSKYLVRFHSFNSSRIGHFAANTELYLCERDFGINQPKVRHVDLFYAKDVCNKQLLKMWKRELKVLPSWILLPIFQINKFLKNFIPSFNSHEVGNNANGDRDILNLLDKSEPHLKFTPEEEIYGKECMKKFGLPNNAKFVCLLVMDSTYLENSQFNIFNDWSYHDYRDGNIDRYVLAAEELAQRGYFVFRMGKKVLKPLKSSNSKIIDYANSKMRSDFMDIYLGGKCTFCISAQGGFDAVPMIFRRPLVQIVVPISHFQTWCENFLVLTKHHILKNNNRKLRLSEIISSEIARALRTKDYDLRGVQIIENSPEEIRDLVLEMLDRLEGTWKSNENDENLQKKFWEIYNTSSLTKLSDNGKPLHGKIKARYGTKFLRENSDWLN